MSACQGHLHWMEKWPEPAEWPTGPQRIVQIQTSKYKEQRILLLCIEHASIHYLVIKRFYYHIQQDATFLQVSPRLHCDQQSKNSYFRLDYPCNSKLEDPNESKAKPTPNSTQASQCPKLLPNTSNHQAICHVTRINMDQ